MDFSPENTTSEYLDLPLGEFLDLVASGNPAPGGGSVAAVAVALAAGLSGMAARLSAGQLADADGLAERADAARRRVAPLARIDVESYRRVLDAYREPDSETRRERVSDALSGATDVPLAVAEVGNEVAGIAARLVEEGNTNLVGDAITAVLLAEAGVRAAVTLAEINLSAANLDDDRLGRANELVDETASTARRITGGHRRG
ncbi:MAG TPA: cyclodeaminase/cyclohydrolase family protein [Rubrobacter sp.]|nr:cyclodeaminase/cyclohydrolase family protein [Rubrobacter sp.]